MQLSATAMNRMMLVVVWFCLTFLYFRPYAQEPFTNRVESDGNYYYHYLVSLVEDRDLDFRNNYEGLNDQYQLRSIETATGRFANSFYIGPALIWTVPYVMTRTVMRWMHLWDSQRSPWDPLVQTLVMYSAVLVGVATFWLMVQLCQTFFGPLAGNLTGISTLFATNVVWYICFEPSMSHAYDLFAMMGVTWFLMRAIQLRHRRSLIYAGAFAGLAISIRVQNLVSVVILSLALVIINFLHTRSARGALWGVGGWALAVALFSAPHFLAYAYIYGDPIARPYEIVDPNPETFFVLTRPMLMEVWFSWHNGLFSFHPAWFIGVMGALVLLVRLIISRHHRAKHAHWIVGLAALLAIFLVQSYLNSCVIDWWAGHSFGQRRLIGAMLVAVVGLGMFIRSINDRGYWYTVLTILLFCVMTVWNQQLMKLYEATWDKNRSQDLLGEFVEWVSSRR